MKLSPILLAAFATLPLLDYAKDVATDGMETTAMNTTSKALVAYLLGISTPEQMARDPLRGNLFENMVVADVFKRRHHAGREPGMGFLRTPGGFEIDLVLREGRETRPVEIKSASTWNRKFEKAVLRYAAEANGCRRPTVVYDGEAYEFSNGVTAANFRHWEP